VDLVEDLDTALGSCEFTEEYPSVQAYDVAILQAKTALDTAERESKKWRCVPAIHSIFFTSADPLQ